MSMPANDSKILPAVPHDPRSVCNLMLDEAPQPLSNLPLQKLLYFAHGLYLVGTGRPLVSGYFEAWTYGPVHIAAYKAFKPAGDRPIEFRASRRDPLTGIGSPLPNPTDSTVLACVRRVLMTYGTMTPGQLVALSHARNAPWHHIVDKSRTSIAFGLRIPDNVIAERFKYHKMNISDGGSVGEPSEDTPLASE